MNNIVISILGSRLDQRGRQRHTRWRPNASLLKMPDFPVHRLELIHHRNDNRLMHQFREDAVELSPDTVVTPHMVNHEDPWDFEQVYTELHDFAMGYDFDPESNNYFVHITTGTHVAQICLYLLTEANYLPGKLLQTSPPPERGPVGQMQLIDLDLSRYDLIAQRFQREAHEGVAWLKDGIETRNSAFNHLMDQLEQVSIRSNAPILLTGPTGAGKSRLARRIHALKQQRGELKGELVEINCATLRGDSAMSALFGHVKGAFTGALSPRRGLLREADGGLLFLDEIGELGVDEQAMLLRAIEDKRFSPFGSDATVRSDFQLIAGTNRDLHTAVREGKFREDLLARINLWRYHLPSLKERIEDLEPNLEHELAQFTRKARHKVSFNKAAREAYLQFATAPSSTWRGNFRDLNASVTRMATLAVGGRITEELVAQESARLRADWSGLDDPTDSTNNPKLSDYLSDQAIEDMDYFEQLQLSQVIAVCKDCKTLAEAGRKLYNVSRTQRKSQNDSHRLKVYLGKYGLEFGDIS